MIYEDDCIIMYTDIPECYSYEIRNKKDSP